MVLSMFSYTFPKIYLFQNWLFSPVSEVYYSIHHYGVLQFQTGTVTLPCPIRVFRACNPPLRSSHQDALGPLKPKPETIEHNIPADSLLCATLAYEKKQDFCLTKRLLVILLCEHLLTKVGVMCLNVTIAPLSQHRQHTVYYFRTNAFISPTSLFGLS